ncbi:MAG: segregation/condensation protein A [Chloroflexi bacterium]|nr:segregation/condensation protein A [Chloroflexota bacterium]MBU1749836.1 segregation/condensation protein A [Chloroflexota bacterium]MBU1879023.1 segregation/condensation protein A [Chloroflexota bacterium]
MSLATVTDQYLEHIRLLKAEHMDAAALADFLVVAAKLLYIKSQVLLPRPPASLTTEEEEDPGEALARQLREYKRFKQVAAGLRQREEAGLHSYARLAPPPRIETTSFRLEGVTLDDLLAAVQTVLARLPALPTADSAVPAMSFSVEDKMAHIATQAKEGGRLYFGDLLRTAVSRVEVIVTFLALLELIRLRQVTVAQETLFEDIVIEGTEDQPPTTADH